MVSLVGQKIHSHIGEIRSTYNPPYRSMPVYYTQYVGLYSGTTHVDMLKSQSHAPCHSQKRVLANVRAYKHV